MNAWRILRSIWAVRESVAFQLGAWALAVAMCLALSSALREQSRADSLREDLALPGLEVNSLPLRKDDYLAVRERVGRTHTGQGVQLVASEDTLTVQAKGLADYTHWRMALADVMLSMPGAVWSVKKMCAGEKCPEGAYSVTLTALVRSLAVTNPRPGGPSARTSAANVTAPAASAAAP